MTSRASCFLASLVLNVGIILSSFTTSACAQTADPTIVFSNLGPTDSFNTQSGWWVSGPQYPDSYLVGWRVAARFQVPDADYIFESADLPMFLYTGGNAVTVSLVSDGLIGPGRVLESMPLTDSLTVFDPSLITARSSLKPTLAAGKKYWLMVDAPGETLAGWNTNTIGNTNPFMEKQLAGAWSWTGVRPTPAFRIWGRMADPIPEPGTALLLLSSGAAWLAWRPRQKPTRSAIPSEI